MMNHSQFEKLHVEYTALREKYLLELNSLPVGSVVQIDGVPYRVTRGRPLKNGSGYGDSYLMRAVPVEFMAEMSERARKKRMAQRREKMRQKEEARLAAEREERAAARKARLKAKKREATAAIKTRGRKTSKKTPKGRTRVQVKR